MYTTLFFVLTMYLSEDLGVQAIRLNFKSDKVGPMEEICRKVKESKGDRLVIAKLSRELEKLATNSQGSQPLDRYFGTITGPYGFKDLLVGGPQLRHPEIGLQEYCEKVHTGNGFDAKNYKETKTGRYELKPGLSSDLICLLTLLPVPPDVVAEFDSRSSVFSSECAEIYTKGEGREAFIEKYDLYISSKSVMNALVNENIAEVMKKSCTHEPSAFSIPVRMCPDSTFELDVPVTTSVEPVSRICDRLKDHRDMESGPSNLFDKVFDFAANVASNCACIVTLKVGTKKKRICVAYKKKYVSTHTPVKTHAIISDQHSDNVLDHLDDEITYVQWILPQVTQKDHEGVERTNPPCARSVSSLDEKNMLLSVLTDTCHHLGYAFIYVDEKGKVVMLAHPKHITGISYFASPNYFIDQEDLISYNTKSVNDVQYYFDKDYELLPDSTIMKKVDCQIREKQITGRKITKSSNTMVSVEVSTKGGDSGSVCRTADKDTVYMMLIAKTGTKAFAQILERPKIIEPQPETTINWPGVKSQENCQDPKGCG